MLTSDLHIYTPSHPLNIHMHIAYMYQHYIFIKSTDSLHITDLLASWLVLMSWTFADLKGPITQGVVLLCLCFDYVSEIPGAQGRVTKLHDEQIVCIIFRLAYGRKAQVSWDTSHLPLLPVDRAPTKLPQKNVDNETNLQLCLWVCVGMTREPGSLWEL